MAQLNNNSWTKLRETTVDISGFTGVFSLWGKIIGSQDVTNNRTKVAFDWDVNVTYGYASSYDAQDYVTGAGWNEATYRTYSSSGNLRHGEVWINHNADGTGSGTATGRTRMGGIGVDTGDITGSFTLPTIPRASVPSASPNPATVGSSGVTVTINTNRKASFTHTLTLTCGSWTSTQTGIGESTTFSIPYSIIGQFADNSKTATCTITCVTYNGSTNIGTKTSTFTLQTDTSVDHPNIGTIAVEDTNSRTSAIVGADTFIYGISTLQAAIPLTVSGSYTELASAVVTCGTRSQNYTLSGTSQTITFTFDRVDYNSLTVTAYDKRGNSVSKTRSYTLMPYQPVTVTAEARRTTATGNTAVGQIQGIAYGGNYGNASNSLTISYKFKLHDATTWTDGSQTYTKSLSDGQQSYSEAITFADAFDYQYQYDIQIIVNDLFNTATYFVQLMQGLPILSWDETEVDVWGDLHIHDRDNPEIYQNVMEGFDMVFQYHANKNLLMIDATTTTVNGITFTVNDDGTITANGTATADASLNIGSVSLQGNYRINGSPSESTSGNYYMLLRLPSSGSLRPPVPVYADGYEWSANGTYTVAIYVLGGQTLSNVVFKPMIWDARIASDTFASPSPTFSGETVTFPSGLIIKHGSATLSHSSRTTINFSKAFPHACFNVILQSSQVGFASASTLAVDTITASSFRAWNWNGASANMAVSWIAFGY